MRRARLGLILALALTACKGTSAPAASGPPVNVTIPFASYDDHSDTPNEVKQKCKFHEALPNAIAEVVPGATVSTGSSNKILSLTIVTMRGVDPAWDGDSSVIVRGELREDGTLIGDVRIKYSATKGVVGAMGGRCTALDDIAEYMAADLGPWIREPETGVELGE